MNKYPSYFLGQVVVDEKQNVKQEGHGVRYRVLRVGIDDPSLINQPERLRMFDCLLPVTAGAGDGQKMRSVNLSNGDMVFGLHTDSPKNDTGIILGVVARTSLIQYDDYVKTDDLTTASGGDQGGKTTQPQPVNRGRKGGQSNTADSAAEKNAVKQYKQNNVILRLGQGPTFLVDYVHDDSNQHIQESESRKENKGQEINPT